MNDDYVPLSYISQYGYCPRRASLLMNQQLWQENEYTAEGRLQHRHVHTGRVERRADFLKLYDFYVCSDTLKLSGKCDCIEAFRSESGAALPGEDGLYSLYPIEYKHGKARNEPEYEMQLCAQAICLEEMYQIHIPEAALFYIASHQRVSVSLTSELRKRTIETARSLLECFSSHHLPCAVNGPRCKKCSLREECMPQLHRSAKQYCKDLYAELKGDQL